MIDQRRLNNVKKLSRFSVGMENFTFRGACKRKIDGKLVALFFLMSFITLKIC